MSLRRLYHFEFYIAYKENKRFIYECKTTFASFVLVVWPGGKKKKKNTRLQGTKLARLIFTVICHANIVQR